jgi:CDGSH-type Zn-finger protein
MSERPIAGGSAPIEVDVVAGQTTWWCACGRSARQPFCDGTHKGTGVTPLKYTADADGAVWFCTCKQTATPPLCDGSHNRIREPGAP